MTLGCRFWRCESCGAAYFPQRFLCPRCRGGRFALELVSDGVVEEVTQVRYAIGRGDGEVPVLATVITGVGHRMIVRLDTALEAGATVALYEKDGAPHAGVRAGGA